ncbi:hypothetical protein EJ03DRAFT_359229 [Teratosphaeria nubilosa]|uniref:Glyoxylate reductase n=1 Tax=Teratosphaeria nubilosa TaxID=161662 RepID=A0A6G1KUC9_9PEZI|nr:hypothetical protein EJ03DRAFT_359229 [Teratosphaeria nubilosa]
MSSTRAALLLGEIKHARKEWEALSSLVKLKEYGVGSRDDFLTRLRSGEYDDVVGIYRSNESTSVTGPFDSELIQSLPKSLRYIAHNGAGYDNILIDACSERGIEVSSTPVAVNDATADTAMLLLLGALRRITIPFQAVRKGEWRGKDFQLGHDPKNKVLGILGMGGIGQAVAARARAFGMRIQYHNRRRLPENKQEGAKYVSFEELLRTSDVLSLNLALNASTRHIISKPQFDQMKDGIVIINTARGPIIDEQALVDALQSGKVFSAGLDVFEGEPKIHPGLLENENVVLLPHVGTATWETQRAMELLVLENLNSALEGRGLLTQVPEQTMK